MNASERLVAEVLDELHVTWEYEPSMFILRADANGHPKEGFQPDFYLPKYEMYLEVTLQKVMNTKNRKVRLVKEVHGVEVVLITKEDFSKDLKAKILNTLRKRKAELQNHPS